MQETVQSEEAESLFEAAADHYKDAVVSSYIQWGNVHIMKADRKLHVGLFGGGVTRSLCSSNSPYA
jgi:hypothetical protein